MAREENEPLEGRARAVAVEIAGMIREVLPRLKADLSPESLPRLLAAAALARQIRPLKPIIAVCDAGQARVAGVSLTRAVGRQALRAHSRRVSDGRVRDQVTTRG